MDSDTAEFARTTGATSEHRSSLLARHMVSTMWRLVTGAVAALMCTVVLGMHMGQGDAITSGLDPPARATHITPFVGRGASVSARLVLPDPWPGSHLADGGRDFMFKPAQDVSTESPTGGTMAEIAAGELAELLELRRTPQAALWGLCEADLLSAFHDQPPGVLARLRDIFSNGVPSQLCPGTDRLIVGALVRWLPTDSVQVVATQDLVPPCYTRSEAGARCGVAVHVHEWTDMAAFDFLIGNTDRLTGGNVLTGKPCVLKPGSPCDQGSDVLLWIDHGGADICANHSALSVYRHDNDK